MPLFKTHKVAVLPWTLEANSVYYVENGSNFSIVVTDSLWAQKTLAWGSWWGVLEQWQWFESTDYIYSVFWNTTAWEVYRYDRNNNLTKTTANGTGTVPNTITTLNWLTYS